MAFQGEPHSQHNMYLKQNCWTC